MQEARPSKRNAVLAARAAEAPRGPGVYCVLGAEDELLYVGKAGNLHRRLSDWARGTPNPEDVRVHRLVGAVREVRWFECADEREALCREADLIVALGPRLNASMRRDVSTYIGVEQLAHDRWRLSMTVEAPTAGRVYGAFPHLGKGKASWRAVRTNAGYSALLRLMWVALSQRQRRSRLPAKLRGTSPPVSCDVDVAADPDARRRELRDFLSGRSNRLLRALAGATTSDDIPVFMRGPLTDDLQAADEFFRLGPRALQVLRRRHGLPQGPIDADTFTDLQERELHDAIGEFRPPARTASTTGLRRRTPPSSWS